MTAEQALFALAAVVCVAGSVSAVTVRDPRGAGGALLATLLSLGVLYTLISAPVVAGAVVLLALFWVVPAAVHLTGPAPRAHLPHDSVATAGVAAVICVPLLVLLVLAVAAGEPAVNVSLRSTDGYDVPSFGALLAGRFALSAAATALLLLVVLGAARVAGRRPR